MESPGSRLQCHESARSSDHDLSQGRGGTTGLLPPLYRLRAVLQEAIAISRSGAVVPSCHRACPRPCPRPYAVGACPAATESPIGGGAVLPHILTASADRSCADRSRCS